MMPTTSAAAALARRSRISPTRFDIGSDRAPALEGPDERHLVGIFEIATDGQPAGDPADDDNALLQALGEIHRRRLALERRVRREDHFLERRSVPLRLVGAGEQLPDHESLRTDAVEPGEGLDQPGDRLDDGTGHADSDYIPGRRRPPVTAAIFSSATLRDERRASFTAATMRSWSMSTSDGSTAEGSIVTETSSCLPVTTALTTPPPALPSTVMVSSSVWIRSMSCCICWAIRCRLAIPIVVSSCSWLSRS